MLQVDDRFLSPGEHVLIFRSRLLCFRVSVAMVNGAGIRRVGNDLNEISSAVCALGAVPGLVALLEQS